MVIWIAIIERHGCSNVLKRAKLLILGHHCCLLGVKDPDVSLQLSVTRLESSVRKLSLAKVATDLLLLLEAIELIGDSCLLTTLLVQLSDRVLMLLSNVVILGADGLKLLILATQLDLCIFELRL